MKSPDLKRNRTSHRKTIQKNWLNKSQINLTLEMAILFIAFIVNTFYTGYNVLAQEETPGPAPTQTATQVVQSAEALDQANQLLQNMTPEEKVGQLFLITFQGSDAGADTQIYDLISNYHIGGVILFAENDNFSMADDTANSVAQATIGLNRQLQMNYWQASQDELANRASGEVYSPSFVPLIIAISQEGGGYPNDQIINDLTPLPNEMALGAAWTTELARKVGTAMGGELSSLGFNMLIGPSLDILEVSQLNGSNSLGTRSFGGDPYWVAEMGKFYIEGVHLGSDGNMAVVAKHFPGHGGSDRQPEEEVATVRKTLSELKSFELAPFSAVSGNAPSPETTVDGLLTSHIRYQGFQGNIRTATRPVSFDPQALSLLMDLPEFSDWHANDGILVSDDLGSLAVRRFYELTNQPFDMPRRVALNAFLAGNDMLYISDFSSENLDSFSATKATLDFFAQKYREDPVFAQRVDESVARILRLKYKLYGVFSLARILAPAGGDSLIGNSEDISLEVAFAASTLLSPLQTELDETVPDPPNQNDRMVIISDTRPAQQCSDCPEQQILSKRSLEEMILQRYGPQAGGQVTPNNLISYTTSELDELLNTDRADLPIETSLLRANWIIFALLDNNETYPGYSTLNQFLSQRPDLFQQKRLIVFGFGAPYYLDATNISKLTAYYCLYSHIPQFVDVAAYLLFKEHIAPGASPVSVPGISYEISQVLFPDPDQVIPLLLDVPVTEQETDETTITPEPPPETEIRIGEILSIRTGVILDHNGNPVPDNTPVEFRFSVTGGISPIVQESVTVNGIGRTEFTINLPGLLEIQAVSGSATSELLSFDIPPSIEGATPVVGTSEPGESSGDLPPVPTTEVTLDEVSETATQVSQQYYPPPITNQSYPLLEWALAVLISIGFGLIAFRIAAINGGHLWGARAGFLVVIGGLLAYSYNRLGLPGSQQSIVGSSYLDIAITTMIGNAIGLLGVFSWRLGSEMRIRRKIQTNQN